MTDFKRAVTNGGFLDLDADDDVAFTKESYETTVYISRRELLEWLATLPAIEG